VPFTLIHAGKYRTEDKIKYYWYQTITENKQNLEKANNAKHSKTSLLIQHSARRRGGHILQRSWAHTGRVNKDIDSINSPVKDANNCYIRVTQWYRTGLVKLHSITAEFYETGQVSTRVHNCKQQWQSLTTSYSINKQALRWNVVSTHTAVQNLDNKIWKSRVSISTKLRLYNTYILPSFLLGSHQERCVQDWCCRSIVSVRFKIKWRYFKQLIVNY